MQPEHAAIGDCRVRRRIAYRIAYRIACRTLIPVVLLLLASAMPASADTSQQQVIDWISAYSVKYSSPDYLYVDLFADSLRVARCESRQFDSDVINNRRLGALGEVGIAQFHPAGIWWSTPQAQAGYSMFDVEANVAAEVWSIAQGYGPRHWVWCWRNG